MICPYCKGEIPSKDFALKTPEGEYWHYPCSDKALDEWARLKEENAKLLAVVEAAKKSIKSFDKEGYFPVYPLHQALIELEATNE